jgi:hypothetical protein
MSQRQLLTVVAVVSVALVVAAGLTRMSYPVAGGEAPCPDRVWRSAFQGTGEDRSTSQGYCTAESQERLFVVAAALMGLVLISGILRRRE